MLFSVFPESHENLLVENNGVGARSHNSTQSKYVSQDVQSLIRSACQLDPNQRPSASDFLASKILNSSNLSSSNSKIKASVLIHNEAVSRDFVNKSGVENVQSEMGRLSLGEDIQWAL